MGTAMIILLVTYFVDVLNIFRQHRTGHKVIIIGEVFIAELG